MLLKILLNLSFTALYHNTKHESLKGQEVVGSNWNTIQYCRTLHYCCIVLCCLNVAMHSPEMLGTFHPWRYSKPWATNCTQSCFDQRLGQHNLQKALPTSVSCDSVNCRLQNTFITDQPSENSDAFKNERKKTKKHITSIFSPVQVHMDVFQLCPNYFCSKWIIFLMKIRLFSALRMWEREQVKVTSFVRCQHI